MVRVTTCVCKYPLNRGSMFVARCVRWMNDAMASAETRCRREVVATALVRAATLAAFLLWRRERRRTHRRHSAQERRTLYRCMCVV
jgi:hypothetical protein